MSEQKKKVTRCECCAYYVYDDEYDCYECEIDLDEDETARFLSYSDFECPYYNPYDEYKIIQKQN